MLRSKRASLEISIQAIVIIVLAMTLLGLGLGFIRLMFRNISETGLEVTETVRQRILDDLITGDKKLSFPKTEIIIDKGGSQILTVGIRNKKDTSLNYKIQFSPISDPLGNPFIADDWFQLGQPPNGYILNAADSQVRSIRLSIPTGVQSGAYVFTFDALDLDFPPSEPSHIYEQKDVFIVIRG